jgi:hypothetical protein
MFAQLLAGGKLLIPVRFVSARPPFGRLNHVQTDAFNRQNRTIGVSEITP